MEERIIEVCRNITPQQFEAMLLLYESEQGRVVIGCDTTHSNNQKYYKFIDRESGENYLLIIWYNECEPDLGSILKMYPDVHVFTFSDFAHEEAGRGYYLRWLCKQPVIPDFLKELCDEVKKSLELLN